LVDTNELRDLTEKDAKYLKLNGKKE